MVKPFEKWALDFVELINSPSKRKTYILVCIDYVTKWVEAKALLKVTKKAIINFLFEYVFIRFGVSWEICLDQGLQFTSKLIQSIPKQY
jgi:hypothetical protein